jgi:hypothetical protein
VALIRQGNPAWVDQDRDHTDGYTTSDGFIGWVDLDRIGAPQADLHMRVLSRAIDRLTDDLEPVPRLWYFPRSLPGLLIATGDSHGESAAAIDTLVRVIEAHGGTISIYWTPRNFSRSALRQVVSLAYHRLREITVGAAAGAEPTAVQAKSWRARGHEFNPHPWVNEGADHGYTSLLRFFARGGFGDRFDTVRNHNLAWQGWVGMGELQARYGFRMTLDYDHYGIVARKPDGTWSTGFYAGSGLPLRLVNERGAVVPLYQLPVQIVDEQMIAGLFQGFERLSPEQAAREGRAIVESAAQHHVAAAFQVHASWFEPGHPLKPAMSRWVAALADAAHQRGMEIWSAGRLSRFEACRTMTTLRSRGWDGARLTLDLVQPQLRCASSVLVPSAVRRPLVAASVDGAEVVSREVEAGWLVNVPEGSHRLRLTFAPTHP